MSLSAASLGAALVALGATWQTPTNVRPFGVGLDAAQTALWGRLGDSVLFLSHDGRPEGAAACIDAGGLFLAQQNSVSAGDVSGVSRSGGSYTLKVLSSDPSTGLVLLQAQSALGIRSKFEAVQVAEQAHAEQSALLAVLPTGPVRAEIGRSDLLATSAYENQPLAVNEIRFDAPAQLLAGALLFDDRGNLVGVLGATLQRAATPVQPAGAGGTGLVARNAQSTLVVGYAISPLILDRVVRGFISPSHTVEHPALGAICANAIGPDGRSMGARIEEIVPGSAATTAGLRVGDIIVNIDGVEIRGKIEYARSMLSKDPGAHVTLAVRRADQVIAVELIVGKASDLHRLQQEVGQSR